MKTARTQVHQRLANAIKLLPVKSLQKSKDFFQLIEKNQTIKSNSLTSSTSWRLSFWLQLVRVGHNRQNA